MSEHGDTPNASGHSAAGADRLRPLGIVRRPEVIALAGLFLVAGRLGVVAGRPGWVYVVVVGAAAIASELAFAAFGTRPRGARLWAQVAVLMAAMSAAVYATGWGFALGIGYVFVLGDAIRRSGSDAGLPVIIWSLTWIAAGEGALDAGLVPSGVAHTEAHGLATVGALGIVIMGRIAIETARDREQADLATRAAGARFRALVESTSDIVMIIDDSDQVTYVSPAFSRVLGYSLDVPALLRDALVHEDDEERTWAVLDRVREAPSRSAWSELRTRDAAGAWHWFEVSFTNQQDEAGLRGIVAMWREVTERKLFEQQLSYQAYHDPLTALPNRTAFLEHLRRALNGTGRSPGDVAVLVVDLDEFKSLNDRFGHDVGDRVLVELAGRLRGCVRAQDVVARFGGDEFTFLLSDFGSADGPVEVAERVLFRLQRPVAVGGSEIYVTASIGMATASPRDLTPRAAADVLREADLALYAAKEHGGGQSVMFDKSSAPPPSERGALEGELWDAVDDGQLVVHFQPEVRLSDARVVAMEALVRWHHPYRGMLLPATFLPLADGSSLSLVIDRFVLRTACAAATTWTPHPSAPEAPVVAVNLSPGYLREPDVVEEILHMVERAGLPPRKLQVEVSQRAAFAEGDRVAQVLWQLHGCGVRVALDDFGSGYAVLSSLRRFPIDELKLDRALVAGIAEDATDAAIVRGIVTTAHALGIRVVAVGVERGDQVDQLYEIGCDVAQGYRFADALTPDASAGLFRGDDRTVRGNGTRPGWATRARTRRATVRI